MSPKYKRWLASGWYSSEIRYTDWLDVGMLVRRFRHQHFVNNCLWVWNTARYNTTQYNTEQCHFCKVLNANATRHGVKNTHTQIYANSFAYQHKTTKRCCCRYYYYYYYYYYSKTAFSGPSDEGTPAILRHFCLARIGFQRIGCERPVIRGHLSNVYGGKANQENFHPLPGVMGQFASCEYPLNIDFYSTSAVFIDLARNSPCGSAQMVEAEPEATHEH